MKDFCEIIGLVFLGILLYAVIMLVLAFPAMWLWNAVMPIIFGLPQISYWVTYGFLLLIRFVFPGLSASTKKSS